MTDHNDERHDPPGNDHELTQSLLPAAKGPDADDRTAEAGDLPDSIGRYRILRQLGQGGMGVVYEAEQQQPRRHVALKVMRQGSAVDELRARMFEREAATLARLEHPNIAAIYEAGRTDHDEPFIAMELVQGETLDSWLRKRPSEINPHELELRLGVFRTIADAVHAAHQRGVIHRDLKPGNIMVTTKEPSTTSGSSGSPATVIKILDFGLARLTDADLEAATMLTEVGMIKGTLPYMAPEQARGDAGGIDVRTDVYALGVILYEMLTGNRPYDLAQAALIEAVRVICEQEPAPLSTSWNGTRRLDADVETIVRHALEKEPGRRYGSAAAMAEDVERYLLSQPIAARPPTVGYRMSRFVRRHRLGVAAASFAVIALIAVAITMTYQAAVVARERDRAEAEAAKAAAMNEFLAATLTSANPWTGGDRATTVVQALDAAERQIETAFEGQPEVEASMRTVIGNAYLGLGELEPAATQIERAVRMRIDQEEQDLHSLGELRLIEATLQQRSADYDSAVESAADAVRIFSLDAEAELEDQLNACQLQTRTLLYARRFDEAKSSLERCEEMTSGVEAEELILSAENFSLRADLYYERDGNAAEAESYSRQAYERARAIDPDNGIVPTYLNNVAQYHSQSGDFEGALADFDLALALYEKRFGTDHPEYATCLENRGGVLYQLGRPDETLTALEQVRDIRSRNLGPNHIDVVRTSLNVGTVAMIGGDFERALSIFQELKPILIEARGIDHPDVLAVLRNEGMTLGSLNRNDEALVVSAQALEISERLNGSDHPQTARARIDYGIVLARIGRSDEAEQQLVTAFDAFLADVGAEHPSTRNAAQQLVKLYEQTGRADEADRFRAYAGE